MARSSRFTRSSTTVERLSSPWDTATSFRLLRWRDSSRCSRPASELLARVGKSTQQDVLDSIFRDWERWAAEVLESHLSYPALSFFRSQHNNQSWLGALVTILDASALVIAGVDELRSEQAKITFAMARHAVVDLAQVVNARYNPQAGDRLPETQLNRLRQKLAERGVKLGEGVAFQEKLDPLRSQ